MITYDEAIDKILEKTPRLGIHELTLDELLGSVLAQPANASFDLPRFDNSAMDGFGVKASDVKSASNDHPTKLTLSGTIQAGDVFNETLSPGHAVKILTGAPIPKGADAVVMKEYCTETESEVCVMRSAKIGDNIRKQGEEFRTSQEVLTAGTRVTPPVIGMLATLGYSSFPVYEKPSVGLLSTGNELVMPGKPLEDGEIYNSNLSALKAAIREIGLTDCKTYFAPDDRLKIKKTFQDAYDNNDVVITMGGISVGDFDFVKDVVEESGIQTVFWRIAIKPGKPVYFGYGDHPRKLVFGLPGNPVSALLTFHQLVQPALLKMMGAQTPSRQLKTLKATLNGELRKKPGRLEFVRGVVSSRQGQLQVVPTQGQDSHMLGGLAKANCLIVFPKEQQHLQPNESVTVELLEWK